MLYNSDSYVVVRFEMAAEAPRSGAAGEGAQAAAALGGYEIVDKFARKEIFLQGAMAAHFQENVEALIQRGPTEEEVDAFLQGFASLMQQPVVLH